MKSFKTYFTENTLIQEALSNELMYLQRYLTMPSDDMDTNRARSNPWMIEDFVVETDYELPKEIIGHENYEIVEWLEENDKPTMIEYGQYVAKSSVYNDSSEKELYDMVDYKGFVRDQWLVHFSDDASSIWRNQKFSYGTEYSDYARLGLSTHFSSNSKSHGGFNFAYLLSDVNRYAFDYNSQPKYGYNSQPKYGSEAILFAGDGIKIYHYGDDEPQVIFDGKATRPPLIYIQYGEDGWEINSNRTSGKIIRFDDIEKIGYWVDNNYAQYHKHLEPTK